MKATEREELLQTLKARFEENVHRHVGVAWADVRASLEGSPDALKSLRDMEATGGEPDVVLACCGEAEPPATAAAGAASSPSWRRSMARPAASSTPILATTDTRRATSIPRGLIATSGAHSAAQ